MARRRVSEVSVEDLDRLWLRVGAKLLNAGVRYDSPTMVLRAASVGLTPTEHRDAALAAETASPAPLRLDPHPQSNPEARRT